MIEINNFLCYSKPVWLFSSGEHKRQTTLDSTNVHCMKWTQKQFIKLCSTEERVIKQVLTDMMTVVLFFLNIFDVDKGKFYALNLQYALFTRHGHKHLMFN